MLLPAPSPSLSSSGHQGAVPRAFLQPELERDSLSVRAPEPRFLCSSPFPASLLCPSLDPSANWGLSVSCMPALRASQASLVIFLLMSVAA